MVLGSPKQFLTIAVGTLYVLLATLVSGQRPAPPSEPVDDPATVVANAKASPVVRLAAARALVAAANPAERPGLFAVLEPHVASFEGVVGSFRDHEALAKDHTRFEWLLLLADLDPKRAAPLLAEAWPALKTSTEKFHYGSWESQRYRGLAGRSVEHLFAAGDSAPAEAFVELLAKEDSENLLGYLHDALQPVINHPEHPALAKLAEQMFNGEESKWNPMADLREGAHRGHTLLPAYREAALVAHPAFQKQLHRLLGDDGEIGTIRVLDAEAIAIAIDDGWTDSETRPGWRGTLPAKGTKVRFRVCDVHAWLLSQHEAFPACELFWPVAKRDVAVRAARARVAPDPLLERK